MPLLASLLAVASLRAGELSPALHPAAPAGWRRTEPKPGIGLYVPGDLKSGETYSVALYPAESLGGKDAKGWLTGAIVRDPLAAGPGSTGSLASPQVQATEMGPVTMAMAGGPLSGGRLAALYIGAAKAGGDRGRMVRIVMSSQSLYARYEKPTGAITGALASVASGAGGPVSGSLGSGGSGPGGSGNAGASSGGAGTKSGGGAKAGGEDASLGGPIRAGVYEGAQTWGGKPHRKLRVTLYGNGEYRLESLGADGSVNDAATGEYRYDPAKGTLAINSLYSLVHNASDPRDETCVFATVHGTPVIYGDEDRGFSRLKTTLLWKGEATRPAPKAEAAAKGAREAEERRYKFVVPPGKGLKTEAVEAVVHSSRFVFNPMGSVMSNTVTVLLKDGTAHEDFPAPLEAWDVAASRKGEPKAWGKWKRSGKGYVVSWGGRPYEDLQGSVVAPAPASGRLEGTFGAGRGGGNLMFSSYSLWGVRLGKDGRFQKSSSSGTGSTSTYTDATGVVVATGSDSIPERNHGTYRLEGYTAILKYDDGRVERTPFFILDGEMIWFEGSILLKDGGK